MFIVIVYTNNKLLYVSHVVGTFSKEEADKYKKDNDIWGSMSVVELKRP